ncbi:Pfs domain protein [Rhexocercosporidium sp. MPI-PUGE-AT-0058]|nr:Pfs domain protein [Rhexocercosporidium sp. MPI-PUGE-AT-0058]
MAAARIFSHDDYTVGWICALPLELAAAMAMLDDIHPDLPVRPNDRNIYTLGRIGAHNVVVTCCPGVYGTISAATAATQMYCSFKSIRYGLMVGIGAGVPSMEADIRLGDIVVSKPTKNSGGVVQYDFGKIITAGHFERTGMLNRPPQMLLRAIEKLQTAHLRNGTRMPTYLSEMVAKYPRMSNFIYPSQQQDRLFQAAYDHVGSNVTCDDCDDSRLVDRPTRDTNDPTIHYGLIGSGNRVIKNSSSRDQLARELGVLCLEMEVAGLMDFFPCLVIRGIGDYADSHKNKTWQRYAAATAAAYAKEIISVIPTNQVAKVPTIATW